MKEIYFAAGCFWGAQHFFAGVDGVKEAVAGYANGNGNNPSYEEVYTDTTGFAETVRVTYDENRIGVKELAELYFTIIDPLSLNRQGHDEGTRYRTGIYYSDPADLPAIQRVYDRIAGDLKAPLAVEVKPLKNFHRAEEEHQDYLDKHPQGYCHISPALMEFARAANEAAGDTD